MKKAVYVSGICAFLLLSLLLVGWAGFDYTAKNALNQGNKQYALAEYQAALALYEKGLEASPLNEELNFNAAQAARELGEYEKATQYYENAKDCVDKYLNAGNIFFEVGKALEDEELKAQCYANALQIYQEGIVLYPQNIPLKYNYEFVKSLLDIESQNENSDQSTESDGEQSDEQQGEQGEASESEQGEDEQSQSQESQEGEEQEEEDQSAAQEGEDSVNIPDQDEGNEEEGEELTYSDEEEYDADMEAIQRILEILESQEEESLKNNQSVVQGKDGKIDW